MKGVITIVFFLMHAAGLAQTYTYEHIVFEGAGIRGIAYSGVIRQLEHHGIVENLTKVGGTSAGAITALMLSLGYSSAEIYEMISETKFQQFNDGGFVFFGGFSRLFSRYGWYKGNTFTRWIEKIIGEKTGNPDITFEALRQQGFKQLYVTATCLNRQTMIVLSHETYPNMKVKDAIRISMSIPLYFAAVFMDSTGQVYRKPRQNQHLDVVIDGGILANFPIFMFDSTYVDSLQDTHRIPNDKTIGVRMDSGPQIHRDSTDRELSPVGIGGIRDYIAAFYTIVLENLNRSSLTGADWERTISVSSVGVGPKIQKLTNEQKMSLIRSGEHSTLEFLRSR